MEELPMDETVEIDEQRFVALSFDRSWPKYVVNWSVKQRMGESDFPIVTGSREGLPAQGESREEMWQQLRQEALEEAQAAAGRSEPEEPKRKGLWGRLFGA